MAKKYRKKITHRHAQCECSDPGCPTGHGSQVCLRDARSKLYRIDMDDRSGTYMCPKCQRDALESGVFE